MEDDELDEDLDDDDLDEELDEDSEDELDDDSDDEDFDDEDSDDEDFEDPANLSADAADDEDAALRQSISDGYDADAGPLETGYASEAVPLSEILNNAALDDESLSLEPEDLGRHALQSAAQQGDPIASPARIALDEAEPNASPNPQALTEPSNVDLTQSAIREGSLFDQAREGEETKLRHPLVNTNEVDAGLKLNERAQRAGTKTALPGRVASEQTATRGNVKKPGATTPKSAKTSSAKDGSARSRRS
ncbi:MAG TPA: hypothetical protein VFQ61_38970 [Polyangiaceae bacterium]|nr:hypothetical protein [Polyangiaceae bacterium]